MKLDELKNGLATAWDSMTDSVNEGWQRLRKAGNAITHFNASSQSSLPENRDVDDEAYWPRTNWAVLSGNVFEDDTKVVVRLEIPGMKKEDFKLDVQNDTLTVSGEKHFEREESEGRYRSFQCAYGSFRRSLRLPASVLAEQATANYRDGILRVELPKATPSKPKSIEVPID